MINQIKAGAVVATTVAAGRAIEPVATGQQELPIMDWRRLVGALIVGVISAVAGIGIEWLRRKILGNENPPPQK